jgi:hypothetical protein
MEEGNQEEEVESSKAHRRRPKDIEAVKARKGPPVLFSQV